jgi:hypothetical protein
MGINERHALAGQDILANHRFQERRLAGAGLLA